MSRCPHPTCSEDVPRERVFCRPHWFGLPKPLRDAIWDAYRRKDRDASLRNIGEAVRYYRDKEGATR